MARCEHAHVARQRPRDTIKGVSRDALPHLKSSVRITQTVLKTYRISGVHKLIPNHIIAPANVSVR
jgi:hypothetical protein